MNFKSLVLITAFFTTTKALNAQRMYREKTIMVTDRKTGETIFTVNHNYLLVLNSDRLKVYDTTGTKSFQLIKIDKLATKNKVGKEIIRWSAVDNKAKECTVTFIFDANEWGGKDKFEIEYPNTVLGYTVNEVKE